MFNTQKEALADLMEFRPRGPVVSDKLKYAGEVFEVVAFQQWASSKVKHAVGLVWKHACSVCGETHAVLTPYRPQAMTEVCARCDLTGPVVPPTFEVVLGGRLLAGRLREPKVNATPATPEPRVGIVEGAVLDAISELRDLGRPRIACNELIARTVFRLAPPPAGKRDVRRQNAARAIKSLCGKNWSGMAENGHLIAIGDATNSNDVAQR